MSFLKATVAPKILWMLQMYENLSEIIQTLQLLIEAWKDEPWKLKNTNGNNSLVYWWLQSLIHNIWTHGNSRIPYSSSSFSFKLRNHQLLLLQGLIVCVRPLFVFSFGESGVTADKSEILLSPWSEGTKVSKNVFLT